MSILILLGAFLSSVLWNSDVLGTTFDEVSVGPPLAKMRVTRHDKVAVEIFATLKTGSRLEKVVNLKLFDGFEPRMTRKDAISRFGPPSGEWLDPYYLVQAPFYTRPTGRVSLCNVPTSFFSHEWTVVAYPIDKSLEGVINDEQLRKQIVPLLPQNGQVDINILRSVGWGGLSILIEKGKCVRFIITAREGQTLEDN